MKILFFIIVTLTSDPKGSELPVSTQPVTFTGPTAEPRCEKARAYVSAQVDLFNKIPGIGATKVVSPYCRVLALPEPQ